jgi:DNA end-binding protein Ku
VAQSSWKAFIKLSLVSIPVRAYSASVPARERITLNQLHETCHSRIRYKKTCPLHGEVPNDEIVKGYEYSKDQYVVVDEDELDRIKTGGDRAVMIQAFVHAGHFDPIYFAGKSYYLVPDGPAGLKPYALLREALVVEDLHAVAQVVLFGKQDLMLMQPLDGILTISTLEYQSEVRSPADFAEESPHVDFSKQELDLTKALLEATTADDFDFSKYHDTYAEDLRKLVESKLAGKQVVTAPSAEPRPVINLMDALKESVAQAKGRKGVGKRAKEAPPPRQRSVARRKRRP